MRRHLIYLTDSDSIHSPEACAVTTSALFLSHSVRRDVRLYLTTPNYTITLDGSTIRLLRPDEQSTRGLLKKAVARIIDGGTRMPQGFTLREETPGRLLEHLPNSALCFPSLRGQNLGDLKFESRDPVFITGLSREKILEAAEASVAHPVRLSRWPLPPSHEIALFNILLDRMGMNDGDSTGR